MPEEGHPLREWRRRAEHPVDPPRDEVLRVDRLLLRRVVGAGENGRLGRGRLDKPIDGLPESVVHRLLVLGRRRAERRSAEEVRDLRLRLVERRDPVDGRDRARLRRGLARKAERREVAAEVVETEDAGDRKAAGGRARTDEDVAAAQPERRGALSL